VLGADAIAARAQRSERTLGDIPIAGTRDPFGRDSGGALEPTTPMHELSSVVAGLGPALGESRARSYDGQQAWRDQN
jgi:hypothetical protein